MEYVDMKKVFLLTIMAILVFIITVIGVSYAWSTFYDPEKINNKIQSNIDVN